jgi:hypothetical protein
VSRVGILATMVSLGVISTFAGTKVDKLVLPACGWGVGGGQLPVKRLSRAFKKGRVKPREGVAPCKLTLAHVNLGMVKKKNHWLGPRVEKARC